MFRGKRLFQTQYFIVQKFIIFSIFWQKLFTSTYFSLYKIIVGKESTSDGSKLQRVRHLVHTAPTARTMVVTRRHDVVIHCSDPPAALQDLLPCRLHVGAQKNRIGRHVPGYTDKEIQKRYCSTVQCANLFFLR